MITIISDDANQNIGQRIYKELCSKKIEVEYISISDTDIRPCYSCGGCTYKTYGKCVVRDDGDKIYPKLIGADVWLFVTPIRWGTYSFKTKRMLDKLCVIGDRHYSVVRGEIVKSMQGNIKKLYAVGIKDDCSTEEKFAFSKLVAENINIMNISGGSFIVDSDVGEGDTLKIAEEISKWKM